MIDDIVTKNVEGQGVQARVDRALSEAFAALDFPAVRARYLEDDELIVLPRLLPPAVLAPIARELSARELTIHRSKIPFVRKAGHVGWRVLARRAPYTTALYQSQAFLDFMSRLADKPMFLKHPEDDHACASYHYTERGDGMQFHFDDCGCEPGASYSMIVGVVDDSTQRFLWRRGEREDRIATAPGSMILFCGSKVWHGVSPLGRNERRTVLSLSYTTEPQMSTPRRFAENLKDALLYFGPSALWQDNYTIERDEVPLTVLVTGASRGIGAEVARQYALRGARLALLARNVGALNDVAAACRARGATEVQVIAADVRERREVEGAIASLRRTWPTLDRAYLNAGGYGVEGREALAHERDRSWTAGGFSSASAERVMDVNYFGVTRFLEPVLAWMRERRAGTIALTGAQAADRGYPKHGPYAASKAALRALADALRADAAGHGVRVCLIEPGCVESGLTDSACCEEMPFIQPVDRAVRAFVRGVERGTPVVRFPAHASWLSRAAAVTPRPLFDLWARTQL